MSPATTPSLNPRTGEKVRDVPDSTPAEFEAALELSATVAEDVASLPPAHRADWLQAIAADLLDERASIVEIGTRETGLDPMRLERELHRTAEQWRFYGEVAREGSWIDATIDHATDGSPDLRRYSRSLGTVAVFGASNFPLAFGMLGNDTASAIAAGCPVVAKCHPAHPQLAFGLAEIAIRALSEAGAPEGVFHAVAGFDNGRALVTDHRTQALAFTGSQRGGLALHAAALGRDIPIPVYAEMGTVNAGVLLESLDPQGCTEAAEAFVRSLAFGAGQVCTKPGLALVPSGSPFADAAAAAMRLVEPRGWALTPAIAEDYARGLQTLRSGGASPLSHVPGPQEGWGLDAALLSVAPQDIERGSVFTQECFGPVGLIAEYDDVEDALSTLERLQGALAGAVFGNPDDPALARVARTLAPRVGRVVINEWTAGVATTWAQHHGGPWPATTAPASSSVGSSAFDRFVRPLAFQNAPHSVLPPPVQEDNPWGIPQRIDGRLPRPQRQADPRSLHP